MDIKDKNTEQDKTMAKIDQKLANRDPITGASGSHPVGTAAGSAGGAAVGAVVGGAVGGPVGAVIGGVVGAVAGGATGHAAGEAIDPTVELVYWKEIYTKRPYYREGKTFSYYEPAYRYGVEAALRPDYRGRDWKALEADLARGWTNASATNREPWNDLRDATHDAWSRANRFGPSQD